MSKIVLEGNAQVYGDDINTDVIIPGKYTKTLDLSVLADHVLEDLDPSFRNRLRPGDILVAGDNFGCGSSREQAPLALKSAGLAAVVARYFARIFFRNAINVGLPVVEVDWSKIKTGDRLSLDLTGGKLTNRNRSETFRAAPLSPGMTAILHGGGLVEYLKKNCGYPD